MVARHTANQVEGPTPEEALEHAKKTASRWASNLFAEKKQDQQQTKKTKFGGFGKKQAGAPGGQGRGGPGGAGAVASKRPRYPYSVYEYFPDEQKVFEEDESSATIEITATGQQLLVDKPSRMVFTMDEEPVEIGMWIEYAKQAH